MPIILAGSQLESEELMNEILLIEKLTEISSIFTEQNFDLLISHLPSQTLPEITAFTKETNDIAIKIHLLQRSNSFFDSSKDYSEQAIEIENKLIQEEITTLIKTAKILSTKIKKAAESFKNTDILNISLQIQISLKEIELITTNVKYNSDKKTKEIKIYEIEELTRSTELKIAILDEKILSINKKSNETSEINRNILTEVELTKNAHSAVIAEIEEKNKDINKLLSHVSERIITEDYEQSAAEEKKMANILRYFSLFFMAIIFTIVCITLLETKNIDFKWQTSIFRISLTFILLIPTAYLARESTKHREKQYEHLQTSLDLKAITPYLASLPEADRHKFKIEIANRLFAVRTPSKSINDSLPTNMQEIIMAIIKKLEITKMEPK